LEASNAIETVPASRRNDSKYGRLGPALRTATYRPDIDVLRCLAILAVLFYHFKIKPFSGGFVGVDIFFVISGYLITGIISNEMLEGIFSFSSFYNRRARRLVPALFTTILLTFVVSYFVFFPADFIRQSRATVFSLLGASNLLFWTESGYFDVDSVVKPLLHTWSLSVEFQFYAVWPVFIYFLVKAKRYTKIGLSAAAAISFVACQYMLYEDSAAAFFLTPFRIWEFAVGGLVVLLERRRIQNVFLLEGVYLTGLFLIVACIVGYGRDTLFPGLMALPPVIGTAFMIYAGSRAKASALFDQYPLRYVGQISYSLYLVHWPILVFSLYTPFTSQPENPWG
jgi:peptidoglycan/LPS O-acetylase OafA/YrhL